MPANILGLTNWEVLKLERDEHDYHVHARYTVRPTVCPKCGVDQPRLYMHAVKEQTFMDTPMHGRRVGVVVQRPRYKCRECGETFQQELPDMDESRRMTKRLVEHIGRVAIRRPFTEVAHEVGVHEKTVRLVFADYVTALEASTVFETPEVLGIDELVLLRKPRLMVVNVAEAAIYDMLATNGKQVVINYLHRLPERERVRLVTIDMYRPYLDAVHLTLPQATVVIDKFHVVKMATEGMEVVRRKVTEDLTAGQRRQLKGRDRFLLLRRGRTLTPEQRLIRDAWLGALPSLRAAYEAKEGFYDVYDAPSRAAAEAQYARWLETLDPMLRAPFHKLTRAVRNWHAHIFAFFDHPVTNALTEAANGVAKVINRMGRGYSFDAVRAKVLFSGLHRAQRPAFGAARELREHDAGMYLTAAHIRPYREFGVSIPNILALSPEVHAAFDSTQLSE